MAIAFTISQKRLGLVLDAIDARIESEIARYQITPPSDDAAGDYGNDLHNLRLQRHEFAALHKLGTGTATEYECWSDPADSSLCLLRFCDVHAARQQGHLSDQAICLYQIIAHTGEEAMAIHYLRQGWAPYVPMGETASCPTCSTPYFPLGYGDCWRCGHIG